MNNNQQIIPQIFTQQIQDSYTQKNFVNLQQYFQTQNQLLNFSFFDLSFTAAVSNKKFPHGFSYAPVDILVLKISGSGTVQFNTGLFDATNMNISTTGACRVRFLVGTYWNQANAISTPSTDVMQAQALGSSGSSGATTNGITSAGSALKMPNFMGFFTPGTYYYKPSAGVLYARIKGCGAGGGGGSGGATAGTAATAGSSSTFGSIITLGGGGLGTFSAGGGVGGILTLPAQSFPGASSVTVVTTTPYTGKTQIAGLQIVYAQAGMAGSWGTLQNLNTIACNGGWGGSCPLFGAINGSSANASGKSNNSTTGCGGPGGGSGTGNVWSAGGGGGGAWVDMIASSSFLTNANYFNTNTGGLALIVGTGGIGGVGNSVNGGPGGNGGWLIEEYFQ